MADLNWQEIKDFGGLWTAGSSFLMPADRAQVMSGCHPQPGGGLRAFLRVASTVDGTALDNGTNDLPVGFGINTKASGDAFSPPDTSAPVSAPTFLIVSVDEAALEDWQLWRREMDRAPTTWARSTAATFAGDESADLTPPPGQPQFARLINDACVTVFGGETEDYVSLAIQGSLDDGVFHVNTTDGSTISTGAWNYGAYGLVEHQARLVTGARDLLQFSAVGLPMDWSGATSGSVRLNPEGFIGNATVGPAYIHEGTAVAWMISVPPGDLIAATRDGRIYNIQGDLSDPTVRELGRWTGMLPHEPVNTPNGLFFILPNQGVAKLTLDGGVELVSPDLLPAVWNLRSHPQTGLGQLAATERFLFAPNAHQSSDHSNGPLVHDFATGAWFTATHSDDYTITNPLFMQPDNNPRDSSIWVVSQHSPGTVGTSEPLVFQYRTGGGYSSASLSTEPRAETWEWKSAPFRDPSGRRIVAREVEVSVYTYNSDSTMQLTVGDQEQTRSLPLGPSLQRFVLSATGEYLDVALKAKSNESDIEAPTLEAMRIGSRPGPRI